MGPLGTPRTSTMSWSIDPAHSVAEFKVRHVRTSNVRGQSTSVTGVLALVSSQVEAGIDAASVYLREAQRDARFQGVSMLGREKFPTLSFKSTRISCDDEGELAVAGDLTIHGITHKAVFTVEGPTPPTKDPCGNITMGLSATTKINRRDFGLTWSAGLEPGGIPGGDEVTITLDIQFVKA